MDEEKSQVRIAWGRFRRDRMALLGITILFIVVFLAIFAPLLSPHHPYEMDVTKRLRPPGTPGYLLGADEAGRDILSRLLWGGRISWLPRLCRYWRRRSYRLSSAWSPGTTVAGSIRY